MSEIAAGRQLDSWKEIAAYLARDVRTVQRWEQRDGLPVHRLQHTKLGSVFAYTTELDAWRAARDAPPMAEPPSATAKAAAPRWRVWTLAMAACAGLIVLAAARAGVWPGDAPLNRAPIRSLAVLPLDDFSADPESSFLADGVTEALIAQLSANGGLRVISRTSVLPFKNAKIPVPEIARALKVDAVIEGSVMRSGDRVRVTVQLVRAETGETLWSNSYNRELGDVLLLESEVAQVIASRVRTTVAPAERAGARPARTIAPDVYQSYLKGRFFLNSRERDPHKIEESIRLFEEVIARDRTFAPAQAGLASAYENLGSTGTGTLPVADVRPKVVAAAERALELDPDLAEAQITLARTQQQDWHWSEAEAGYRRALEIDPNNADAHGALGGLLVWRGRTEEGLASARLARELDPLAPPRTRALAWLLYHARRYDEAIRELQTVLAADPHDVSALWFLGFALTDASRVEEAIQVLERLVTLWNRNPAALGALARAYSRAGRQNDALRVLDELKRRERVSYVPPAVFVHAYVGLGDRDRAFASLERAYRERSNIIQFLKTHPLYDPLRSDPRFTDLMRRVGLQ